MRPQTKGLNTHVLLNFNGKIDEFHIESVADVLNLDESDLSKFHNVDNIVNIKLVIDTDFSLKTIIEDNE